MNLRHQSQVATLPKHPNSGSYTLAAQSAVDLPAVSSASCKSISYFKEARLLACFPNDSLSAFLQPGACNASRSNRVV